MGMRFLDVAGIHFDPTVKSIPKSSYSCQETALILIVKRYQITKVNSYHIFSP